MKKSKTGYLVFLKRLTDTHFFRVMRVTVFLILIGISSVFASSTYSQATKFTLELRNVSLEQLFEEIQSQSEFNIFYKNSQVDKSRIVDITVSNASVEDILTQALEGLQLDFKVTDRQIVIFPEESLNNERKTKDQVREQPQKKEISGKITDSNGQSLPGVTIIVTGTTIGTVTDSNGQFTLEIPIDAKLLQISFVGMASQEIPIAGKSSIDVVMVEDAIGIEEVVAIGYGTVKKKDLTGAATSLNSENLMQGRAIVSLEDALKGQISGMRIIQNEGGPGAKSSILIRGATSLEGDSKPLYIVDGFPVSNFDLNAADVASVDVLKDAASTAIYGSQGANGVIIITTKRAKDKQMKINFSAKYGITSPSKKIDMLTAEEYAKQMYYQRGTYSRPGTWDASSINENNEYFTDPEGGLYTMQIYNDQNEGILYPYRNYKNYADSTYTVWQDEVLRDAPFQDYSVSFSKGYSDRSNFLMSLNYVNQDGIIIGNTYDKIVGRLSLNQHMGEKIMLSSNTYFTNTKNEGYTGFTNQMMRLSPFKPLHGLFYDPDKPGTNSDEAYYSSPLDLVDMIDRSSSQSVFNTNMSLTVELLKDLAFNAGGSYRLLNSDDQNYDNSNTINGGSEEGVAKFISRKTQDYTFKGLLTYKKEKSGVHSFEGMLGMEIDKYKDERFSNEAWGFDLELLNFWGMSYATIPQLPSLGYTESILQSYFGRINYIFLDRYLFKFTMRADGSSKFSKNKKWGYFPSAAGAWRISEESFLKDVSWCPSIKLRANWGIVGKQSISPYQSLASMDGLITTVDGESRYVGLYQITDESPNLKWETNVETDIGLDIVSKNGRYSLTADIYRKDTKDLLLYAGTPSYTGYTSVLQNVGSLRNEGVEIQVAGTPAVGDFTWSTNFNISFVRSKVLDIGVDGELFIPNGVIREGQPIGQWFGYETEGIWNSYEEIQAAEAAGFISQNGVSVDNLTPGHTRYTDQLTVDTDNDGIPDAGDGIVNADDRVILGRAAPNIVGGWFNNFSYKNFSLSVGLQYSLNSTVFNQNKINLTTGRGGTNQYGETRDRWFPELYQLYSPDPDNAYDYAAQYDPSDKSTWGPLQDAGSNTDTWRGLLGSTPEQLEDSRYIEDGSFLRLSDVTMAYTFGSILLRKTPFKTAKVYVSGRNLAILTNYSGFDPEVNSGSYKAILPGLDSGAYPRERSFIFGIDLSF